MYQPRRHLSQIHTTNYMPFIREKAAFWKKNLSLVGVEGGRPPHPPLEPPQLSHRWSFRHHSASKCAGVSTWLLIGERLRGGPEPRGRRMDIGSAARLRRSSGRRCPSSSRGFRVGLGVWTAACWVLLSSLVGRLSVELNFGAFLKRTEVLQHHVSHQITTSPTNLDVVREHQRRVPGSTNDLDTKATCCIQGAPPPSSKKNLHTFCAP